jgi:hypothetical protein
MRDYYLKFETEEIFDSVMEDLGWRKEFTFQDVTTVSYGSEYITLDRIGPITLIPGEYDKDFNEITPPVIDNAYHVNLRFSDNTEFPTELETYRITVANPRRIFAGGMYPAD